MTTLRLRLILCLAFLSLLAPAPQLSARQNAQPILLSPTHCYILVGPATKNERGQVRSTSTILNYSCYRTAAQRERAHPRTTSTTTALSRAITIQSGIPLVEFFTAEYHGGNSYRIDGYAGCGAYYYVNNLGWMTKNTESLIVYECKPYQRLHNMEYLDDASNHMTFGLGPKDISVDYNQGHYNILGNYKDNTASWETR